MCDDVGQHVASLIARAATVYIGEVSEWEITAASMTRYYYAGAQIYLLGARCLAKGEDGIETFFRKSDGATLFYNKGTQEFVILHKDGTIGAYMWAEDGWAYWLRQIAKSKW